MGKRKEAHTKLPENVISIETRFPRDTLPTGRFLSALPGIDQGYGHLVGQGMVFWNGMYRERGVATRIAISHIHQETTFVLESPRSRERWEMEENGCDEVRFRLISALIRGGATNPNMQFRSDGSHEIDISFCQGFLSHKEIRKAVRGGVIYACEVCPIVTGTGDTRYEYVKRPSDLPLRRAKDINYEETERGMKGFKSVQEAIDCLLKLRKMISSATPLLTDSSAPPSTDSGLVSSRYFPPNIEE